jgi:hypothetical protein
MAKTTDTTGASEASLFVTHDEDPILSLSEAGRLVGRTHTTIATWCEQGFLRYFRDPSGLRKVRKSDLARFYSATELSANRPMSEE